MNRILTPQQAFESADCMLVQASTMRHCAEQLQTQINGMYHQADALERDASTLQHLGTERRESISQTLDRMLGSYRDCIPQYNAENPGILEKLSLAVEEGCILFESVEAVGDELRAIAGRIEAKSVSTSSLAAEEMGDDDEETVLQIDTPTKSAPPRPHLKKNVSTSPTNKSDSVFVSGAPKYSSHNTQRSSTISKPDLSYNTASPPRSARQKRKKHYPPDLSRTARQVAEDPGKQHGRRKSRRKLRS